MPSDFTTETATQLMPLGMPPGAAPGSRGINLKRLIRTRGPVMAAISLALAVPLLVAAWFVIPREYEAMAAIRFSPTRVSVLSPDQDRAVSSDYGQYVETNVNLIKSIAVLSKVAQREDVRILPEISDVRDPAYFLASKIDARVVPNSNLVQISYKSSDRNAAVTIVSATLKEFTLHALQADQAKDAEVTKQLEEERTTNENKIIELDQEVERRRKNVGGIIGESGGIGPDAERQSFYDNQSKAMADQTTAEKEMQLLEAELEKVNSFIDQNNLKPDEKIHYSGIESIVAADPTVSAQNATLAALDVSLKQDSNLRDDSPMKIKKMSDRNSVAAAVKEAERKARANALLAKQSEIQNKLDSTKTMVDDASTRVKAFDQELSKHAANTLEYTKAMSELKEAEAEREYVRGSLREVKDKIRMVRADSRAPAAIDTAIQPQAPSTPDFKKRLKYMFLVLMMSCGCGFAFGLYRELTDQAVRSLVDLKIVTDLPMMAMIPDLSVERLPGTAKAAMLTAEHPDSISADEFRRVLTRIIYPPEGSAELNTCLVTSASRGDGKTSLAVNLATSLAQANRRVLLLDICARRPSVEKTLGVDRGPGLGEIFANKIALKEAVRSTPIDNLYVMGPGFLSNEVIGKLASREMVEFLEKAEESFEHVIIDSPPTLLMADAKLLAPVVDGVIMVVGAEVSSLGMVRRALTELQQIGSNVIGVVLNRAKHVAGGYMRDNLDKFYNYNKEAGDATPALDQPSAVVTPASIDGEELPTMILLEDSGIRPKQDGV